MSTSVHPLFDIGGADVSQHNIPVDFDIVQEKLHFIIVRAGNGYYDGDMSDRAWPTHSSELLKRPEMAWGSYFNFIAQVDPIEQARKYYNLTRKNHGCMPRYADCERNGDARFKKYTATRYTRKLITFLNECDRLMGGPNLTGIYTSPGFFNYINIDKKLLGDLKIDKRPYWNAQYYYNWKTNKRPGLPAYLKHRTKDILWQFSADKPANGRGREFGIRGSKSIDLNVFLGDEKDFYRVFRCKVNEPGDIVVTPPVDVEPHRAKATARVNLRSGPGVEHKTKGVSNRGAVWPIQRIVYNEKGERWGEVMENVLYISYNYLHKV